jgi:hypothetical protein
VSKHFSPLTFTVVYCCLYVALLATDTPLFRYYPLHGDFNWGPHYLKGVGPAMAWYGLLAGAALPAAVASLLLKDRLAQRLLGNVLWLLPVGAMLSCVYLLRFFFR